MRVRIAGLALIILLTAAGARATGDDLPPWLRQASTLALPSYDKDVTAAVLVDDGNVTINEDGHIVKVYNYAVRIIRREGRYYAAGGGGYLPATSKVKELRAWLIGGDGEVKRFGKDETLDLAGAPNDVYDEFRYKRISAVDEANAGMVFGYTYTTEDRSVFSQDDWAF